MKQQLYKALQRRLATEVSSRQEIYFLRNLDLEELVDKILIPETYLYTRGGERSGNETIFVDIATAIGKKVLGMARIKLDTPKALRIGSFLLYSMEELGIINLFKGASSRTSNATYQIELVNNKKLVEMFESLPHEKIDKIPNKKPYSPWTCGYHQNGLALVKTGAKEVLKKLDPNTHPMVFNLVNKMQKVGWNVNHEVYHLQAWALRNQAEAFNDIWNAPSRESMESKYREAETISSIAERFLDSTFYHQYYYDFRGRMYINTAYLHEQGTDLAKSLLLRNGKKQIGEAGYFWLMVSAASLWGGDSGRLDKVKTDKMPLKDRASWSEDNLEILLSYAENPKVNTGWMKADKPWQFIANCFELKNLMDSDEGFAYRTGFIVYIDGSNNGAQHLSALTLDEATAPYVNLIPSELPGDLYEYVSDYAWESIDYKVSLLSEERTLELNRIIDEIISIKKKLFNLKDDAADTKAKELLKTRLREIKSDQEDIKEASILFWQRITDRKDRRKICKRNVMTIPYGGTPYGMGNQQIDDAKKHGIPLLKYMERRWATWLGREIYNSCGNALGKPMQLLSIFENAGKKAEATDKFLSWTVPVTDFPVVQYYVGGEIRKVWTQYYPPTGDRLSNNYYKNTLQIFAACAENPKKLKRKQAQGAAPNIIHSLDAAHLSLVVNSVPFAVTTVHDSFGCLPGDMPQLYNTTRQAFIGLYSHDPLAKIFKEIGEDIEKVERGNLSLMSILDSEYAFA
jgi:DNA-directed RNA polymerase